MLQHVLVYEIGLNIVLTMLAIGAIHAFWALAIETNGTPDQPEFITGAGMMIFAAMGLLYLMVMLPGSPLGWHKLGVLFGAMLYAALYLRLRRTVPAR
jgi:hypothetical protein